MWLHVKFLIKIKLFCTFLRIFRERESALWQNWYQRYLGRQKPKFLSTRMLMNENFLWKHSAAYQSQNVFQTQTERCQKVGHLRFTQFLELFSFSKAESLSSVFRYFSSTHRMYKNRKRSICVRKNYFWHPRWEYSFKFSIYV